MRISCFVSLTAAVLLLSAMVSADLDGYVARADPEFHWEVKSVTTHTDGKIHDLHFESQVWRGIPWQHRLVIFEPEELRFPDTALMLITGGSGGQGDMTLGLTLAKRTGCLFAILFNIPNQPLCDGKKEDALISYTFDEYLRSGDDTWPLLLPMTKSAVKAMDVVQAYAAKALPHTPQRFVVTGASKRGWTTWLTAAEDKRVAGIAPMVYDNLNLTAQMRHQIETWGAYSEEIHDYTDRGLIEKLNTPSGAKLVGMVDPYACRARITMPKLIIDGTNDRYWVLDAVHQYWDSLIGAKNVLYVPNCGHGLQDIARVLSGITAFTRAVAGGGHLPQLSATFHDGEDAVRMTVDADAAPVAARVWTATSATRDFRDAKWTSLAAAVSDHRVSVDVPLTVGVNQALLGELDFLDGEEIYHLSTPVHILYRH